MVLTGYDRWLACRPLAVATRLSYRVSTAGYLAWLSERTSGHGDPLAEASARDYATRDYKRHLKDLRRTPRTVNKVLAGRTASTATSASPRPTSSARTSLPRRRGP